MTPIPNILSFKRLVPGRALMKQLRHPVHVPFSGRQYSEQVLQNDELEADNSSMEQYDNRLNKTENGSPNLSHLRLPKVNIPIQVIIEYAIIRDAKFRGTIECGYIFSTHAKPKNRNTAGHTFHLSRYLTMDSLLG